MRVKLSYTADSEEIFSEAAFLLTGLGPSIQSTVDKYNTILKELQMENPNIFETQKSISTVRALLGKIDTRYVEVSDILLGYEEYRIKEQGNSAPPPSVPPVATLDPEEEDD